ncbi:hypothetical protein [Methylomonas rivi]|uniref:IPT/TIG domain-containing protein n=1 Tax=Methylomonas rivi TaxID=2952226 RepID=A0ABT1U9V5_9GAMM|nr:hypothetical protein [Methylomonas sp. WSC-6]MCQ8130649.1 hypothetical protein [Methylomonas sp. WSC-6]
MKKIRLCNSMLFVLCFSIFSNCYAEDALSKYEETLEDAADALDNLRALNEEYGEIVMSYPMLQFNDGVEFDLKRSGENYFNDAKTMTQGGAAHALMMANVIAGSLQVKNNPMVSQQYQLDLQQSQESQAALRLYNAKKSAICDERWTQYLSETDPDKKENRLVAYGTCLEELMPAAVAAPRMDTAMPAALNDPKLAEEAKSLLKDTTLVKSPGELLSGITPSVSNRDAIHVAAGDKAVETAYRILGDLKRANQFKDKMLFMATSMVSVNPGWRTREGFYAKLMGEMGISYVPARYEAKERFVQHGSIPCEVRKKIALSNGMTSLLNEKCQAAQESLYSYFPNEYIVPGNEAFMPHPVVAAVSPLTVSQTLDLSNSERNVMEFALALAGILKEMNLEGQASIFEQYVQSNQSDSKTKTVNTVVNSYSINGGQFGYQISPQFQGLDVQGDNESSANILQPQSFPVLLLIGVDQADLNFRMQECKQGDPDILRCVEEQDGKEKRKWKFVEPQLSMKQNFDWLRTKKYGFWGTIGNFFYDPGYYFTSNEPSDYIKTGYELNKKFYNLDNKSCNQSDSIECKSLMRSKKFFELKMWSEKYLLATESTQAIPLDILLAPKYIEEKKSKVTPTAPYISEIIPSKIRLTRKDKVISEEGSEILILGSDFGQLDIDNIVLQGNLTINKRQKNNNQIRLSASVKGDSPISFRIPVKTEDNGEEKNKSQYVFTPPIEVEVIDVKSTDSESANGKIESSTNSGNVNVTIGK